MRYGEASRKDVKVIGLNIWSPLEPKYLSNILSPGLHYFELSSHGVEDDECRLAPAASVLQKRETRCAELLPITINSALIFLDRA